MSQSLTSSETDLVKMKSRSLEPLAGLAMWSDEPVIIELVKGEKGLGFSILDYQVGGTMSIILMSAETLKLNVCGCI